VLQILVNLVGNAKHALQISSNADKKLTLVTQLLGDDDCKVLRLQVRDNGIGIAPSDIMRIFSHGFTTKKDGHGFGLHSSAIAAKEMDGTLSVASEGMGQGATFTLEVPIKRSSREKHSEVAGASASQNAAVRSETNSPIVVFPVPDATSGTASSLVLL
jgi:two-component system NtrC family sensor kinase